MKTIITLLLLLSLNSCSNAQCSNEIIRIYYFSGGGNYNYTTLIGSDSISINRLCQDENGYPMMCAKFYTSPKTATYISKYISNHCNPINRINERTVSGFVIDLICKDHPKECFILGKIESKAYFEGLIKWIENSPYKKECKGIIEDFKPYVR